MRLLGRSRASRTNRKENPCVSGNFHPVVDPVDDPRAR